jgi:hypothetical protein
MPATIARMRIAIGVSILALVSAAAPCVAAPLTAGARLPALTLADQHDVEGSVGADTRSVIFSRDMDAAKVVRDALGDAPAPLLDAARAVIISDISRMPRLITKLFALPAMRKRPFRMLLDRDGKVTADFPSARGKVTVFYLHVFTIERMEYVESADGLRAALRRAAERTNLPAGP